MIVYSSTTQRFRADVMSNDIGDIVLMTFRERTGRSTGKQEIDSWINSLQCMDRILNDTDSAGCRNCDRVSHSANAEAHRFHPDGKGFGKATRCESIETIKFQHSNMLSTGLHR